MPTNKDFKRLVRARMTRTGESYTAARAQLIGGPAPSARPPVRPSPDFAALAGMSDAAVKAKTGCTWERWVWALDRAKADKWPHREVAKYIGEKYKMSSWWSQTVTVGYERIKGLRAIGQRRDGSFEATKSRTLSVPLPRLYRAFSDKRWRSRWLGRVDITVRSATRERSMRIIWSDGTLVQAMFFRKGAGRSQVQIQHGRFQDRPAADGMRRFWGERLDALGELLLGR
jgi:uncharacterized protein YndB with AHSA1/START domain